MHKLLILFTFSVFVMSGAWAQPATVLSGGVGEEGMQALLPQQRAYNVKLVFTLREGDYVAGVSVKIADSNGRTVLEHTSEGPILLARLPAGQYTATLTYEGVTQSLSFTLRDKRQYIGQARWARSAADGPPLL